MGWPEMVENGRKNTNFSVVHGGSRRRFAGPIPARSAAVCREIAPAGSYGCCVPPRPACVAGGQSVVSLWSDLSGSQLNKRLNSVSCLESSFLGFLELKECLGG